MKADIINELSRAAARGEANRSGVEFARFIARLCPHASNGVVIGAYLARAVIDDSHTCLVLNEANLTAAAEANGIGGADISAVPRDIPKSGIVGRPGDIKPLILDNRRLYLHRYRQYEQDVAHRILRMVRIRTSPVHEQAAIKMLNRLFPPGPALPDWQKIAVFNALYTNFLVISGGPGTGKTRTVTALMALLTAASAEEELLIAMCAPTGKAAARLTESVASAASALGLSDSIREKMPAGAHTIHRLLGAGRTPGRFRYNRENPLPFKVLIMDEASMVDLPMMAHLLDALRDDAGLVLLGDKDQLASVEAGSVLSDICAGQDIFSWSHEFTERADRINEKIPKANGNGNRVHELRDCIITLEHSYRFTEGSGITELASAVNRGNFEQARRILEDRDLKRVNFISVDQQDLPSLLQTKAAGFARKLLSSASPWDALGKMDCFRILCGLKRGYTGVEQINRHLEGCAVHRIAHRHIYKGLPVIINRNDYMLELFNGDTGMVWPDETGKLRIWFASRKNKLRRFSPAVLPSFDPAWAITVHRSQGSEFKKVLFILPSGKSAMAGRELLYTAITRAREEITIWGTWQELRVCVENRTGRNSGLGEMVWVG